MAFLFKVRHSFLLFQFIPISHRNEMQTILESVSNLHVTKKSCLLGLLLSCSRNTMSVPITRTNLNSILYFTLPVPCFSCSKWQLEDQSIVSYYKTMITVYLIDPPVQHFCINPSNKRVHYSFNMLSWVSYYL